MIPNTYHWLQSVHLPLSPTKHLNSWALWWVEGWKLLPAVCLIIHTVPPLLLFCTSQLPPSPVKRKTFSLLCFNFQATFSDCILILLLALSSFHSFFRCYFLILPPLLPSPTFPILFSLVRYSHKFICSCEGVSYARVVHGGRESSRAWHEHTLWELPFITPSTNEHHAEYNTHTITFRNSFS